MNVESNELWDRIGRGRVHGAELPALDLAAEKQAIARRIGLEGLGQRIPAPAMVRQRTRANAQWGRRWVLLGAGAGLVAATVLVTARIGERAGDPAAPVTELRHYQTAAAQTARIELPDGSQMQLAPASQVRYGITQAGDRVISLVGQAYFTVAHDTKAPFLVRTGAVTTRVLGTQFDVRRYAADSVAQIAVMSGRVAAEGAGTAVVVTPGMVIHMSDSSAPSFDAADIKSVTAWTNGQLVFREAPVPQMLQAVGRWCDCEFQLADSALAKQHVTTILAVGDPARTLKMLEELLDVRMTRKGRIITLHPISLREPSTIPARMPVRGGESRPFEPSVGVGK